MRIPGLLVAIVLLLAVPSATFTLPSALKRASVSIVSESTRNEFSTLEAQQLEDEATTSIALAGDMGDTLSSTFTTEESTEAAELTIHEWKEKRQTPIGDEEQAVDIMRDLDGNTLAPAYFQNTMKLPHVESYTCPEKDAFRGFMSNACRVYLHPGGETAFYKRIAFEDIDHCQEKLKHAPHKLIRDAKSCQVVASWLTSKACRDLCETTGVHIPEVYDAQLAASKSDPMESKFTFLLEDFNPSNGWKQTWLLDDLEATQATLTTYAKIHAYFWTGSEFYNDQQAADELEAGIWKSGSYVQPEAQNWNQCLKVKSEWAIKKLKFERHLSKLDFYDNLGERLESVAQECGRLAHPFADDKGPFAEDEDLSHAYRKYRTFTHGDPKQANLFFRTREHELPEVGLVDFQWSGFGLASTDLAHFLTSAVYADLLVDGGEDKLRQYYYKELCKYRVEYGGFKSLEEARQDFPYATLVEQYETAVLDLCRLMIAYTWARFTEPVAANDEDAKARTMNKTSYNKSIPNVVWLLSKCDEILKSRGV